MQVQVQVQADGVGGSQVHNCSQTQRTGVGERSAFLDPSRHFVSIPGNPPEIT